MTLRLLLICAVAVLLLSLGTPARAAAQVKPCALAIADARYRRLRKRMIAQNLAHQAILKGHTARFITASELLNELASQETGTALQRKLKQYSHWKLLVIDEVGYLSTTNRHADLLFQVINRRYQEKSIILTTNKPFGEWNEVFPSAPCVVTMVDFS